MVMFGPITWEDIWYSRHHLTVGLARQHKVVLVEGAAEFRALVREPARCFRPARLRGDPQGFLQYSPAGWVPEVYRWPRLRRLMHRTRSRTLLRVLAREDAAPSLVYVWHPEFQEAVEPLDQLPLVYHCYDKYDRYTDAPVSEIRDREAWLVERAVLCVAASSKLGEHLKGLGARQVLVLRHGVDGRLFRPGLATPPQLARIPHPRIGIVARLNEVLDVDSVFRIARDRPSWSLVLVGAERFSDSDKRAQFEVLCRLPNVHQVGPQLRENIPGWLCGFDVGLACYDLATWGPYNQPIKLYEYLACGLPVVSSDIAAARELGDMVECCATSGDWVPAIERALAGSPDGAQRRLAFARENGWDRRVAELDEALRRLPGVDSGR